MFESRLTDPSLNNERPAPAPEILAELKEQLSLLGDEMARITADRAHRAQEFAQSGVDRSRETVSEYPLVSMAGAFALGALVGLALTSSARTRHSWGDWQMRDDLARYADDINRSVRRSMSRNGMVDGLERLASTLSASEAKDTLAPAVERLLGWVGQARDVAKGAVNKAMS